MVNKRVRNAVLGCNLKNDRIWKRQMSVRFQGKSFNITVIQAYAPTSNTEEAEVERFYEDLQDLLELSPDGQHRNQIDYILCSQRWRSSIQSAKTRPGANCGSDHELLIAKFRLKVNKVGKPLDHSGMT